MFPYFRAEMAEHKEDIVIDKAADGLTACRRWLGLAMLGWRELELAGLAGPGSREQHQQQQQQQ